MERPASLSCRAGPAVAVRKSPRTNQSPNRRGIEKRGSALSELDRRRMAGRSRRLLQGADGESLHSASRHVGGGVARVLVGRLARMQQSRSARFVRGKKGNCRASGTLHRVGSAAPNSTLGGIARQSRTQYSGSARFRGRLSRSVRFLTDPQISFWKRRFPRTFRDKNRNTLVNGDLVGITQGCNPINRLKRVDRKSVV